MTVEDPLLQGENVLVIAIDNPHLCLSRRICQMVRRLMDRIRADRLTICGNVPAELRIDRPGVTLIPIRHHGPLEDETEFIMSFESFGDVELLKQIKMPRSALNLFDIAAYDGLIYPYRVSCESDWSGLAQLEGPYDLVIILGGSHFNLPLPERILSTLKSSGQDAAPTTVGLPIGPVTGPLSPHWYDSCDLILVADDRIAQVLKKITWCPRCEVAADLFAGIPAPMAGRPASKDGKLSVLIDWTFVHNWQLKALLRELARHDLRHEIELTLTAVSEETTQMLWAKWGTLLEELEPEWVYINGDEYYRAVSGMDVVVGFVCGRDIWVWRGGHGGMLMCDFAGWWRAFGFEGPDPVASPKRAMAVLAETAAAGRRSD